MEEKKVVQTKGFFYLLPVLTHTRRRSVHKMFVEAFAEKFIKLIAEVVENKVAEVLGVEDELQSLLEKLEDLIGHLGMLRGSAHDPDVGGRVKRLKDIMYNADDLVDLCKVNAERHTRSLENKASASHINWFIVLHHTQPWYV